MKKLWGRLLICPFVIAMMLATAIPVSALDNGAVNTDGYGQIATGTDYAKGVLQAGQLFVPPEESTIDNGDGTYTSSRCVSKEAAVPSALEEYIVAQLKNRATEIVLNDKDNPTSTKYVYRANADSCEFTELYGLILDKHPELFFVDFTLDYSFYKAPTNELYSFRPIYNFSASQIATMTTQFDREINNIVAKVNLAWSPVEKALFLHDYLATHAEYTEGYYDAYEFVVNKRGVCQSYAMTYTYLLDKVGVESKVVTSVSLNHAWNMVKLNGNWYQVDLTWDDPRTNIGGVKRDVISRATHDYFLKSQSAFTHNGTDWIDLNGSVMGQATATNYNNYFWSGVNTAIPTYNGKWFYLLQSLSSSAGEIRAYDFNTNTSASVCAFNHTWDAGNNQVYASKFTGLSMTNNYMIFNNSTQIYAMDVSSFGQSGFMASPFTATNADLTDGYIYGCVADGTQVTYELRTDMETDSTPVRKTATLSLPASANRTISGTVKSYSSTLVNTNAATTIKLYRAGTNTIVYQTTVSGAGTMTYSIPNVAAGSYTIKISKSKHTPREYNVTVGSSNVTQNMELWLYGDVNNSGTIDAADSTQYKRYISAKTSVFDSGATDVRQYRLKVADVNRDNVVNALDAIQPTRYASGKTSVFTSLE